MKGIATQQQTGSLTPFLPARNVVVDMVPWVPLGEGKTFKPLRFFSGNRGFVELLRMEPGTFSPLHRHTGEVHAFNLEGSRELCTGEIIGPGEYVYEPAGNTDTWKVVGDVALVVLVVVMGAVEFIGPDNTITARATADSLMEIYNQHCAANGIEPLDLVD
jgi:2,4'-dihydroxyacetophenone dioxygenase